MKQHIVLRALKLSDYILETRATVRDASKIFNVSKSTVHKDVSERLKAIDREKYLQVKKVLDFNLSERHIRGGNATKEKYRKG
ncbi:MAG: sporulation transcriptional regulator SpoIIID [Clostridiales bacterium]|jgi:putative DeoR family transcriptional regulator (stage III sporulation protein D)|nr:sporulation transcriptional regulator SpoIIID [Clostridiales bacterium]